MGIFFLLSLLAQASGACNATDPASAVNMAAARQAYEQAIRNCPNDAELYSSYAALLIARREYASALDWIAKGLATAPKYDDLRLKQAAVLRALGQPEASIKVLSQVPPSAESNFQAGLDYRAMGRHEEARKSLTAAWDMGFHDPYALYSLIEEEHALGDKAAGMKHFQTFLELFPDSPWLHVLFGNAYLDKARNEDARREYLEALRRDPALPGVNFLAGYLTYQAEQYSAASEYFRRELAVNPSFADASLFLGESLRRSGKTNEAIPALRRALDLNPGSALAYKALGTALAENGSLQEAARIFSQGEKAFPADAAFPAQLSRILARLDRTEDARREAERYRTMLATGNSSAPPAAKP